MTVPRSGEASEGEGPARPVDGRAISRKWKGESSAAARLAGCSGFSRKTGGGRKTALEIQYMSTSPPGDNSSLTKVVCVRTRACAFVVA